MPDVRLKNRGHGILVSSHILEELDQYCDEVLIMHEGRIKKTVDRMETLGQESTSFVITTNQPDLFTAEIEKRQSELGILEVKKQSRNIRDIYLENMDEK